MLSSIIALHAVFENGRKAIDRARDSVSDKLGQFVHTLSPIVEDIEQQKMVKLGMDAIQLALFMGLAPVFHSSLARVKWARENDRWTAAAIDVSYGAIGTSFAFAKVRMELSASRGTLGWL